MSGLNTPERFHYMRGYRSGCHDQDDLENKIHELKKALGKSLDHIEQDKYLTDAEINKFNKMLREDGL